MSTADVIRAWRDEEYRRSLSPEEQAALPKNPAGEVELQDDALEWSDFLVTHSRRIAGMCS